MTLEAPLWIQLGTFASQNDRLLIDTLVADGVSDGRADPVTVLPASGDLACTANTSSLAVDVAPGTAVITGTDQTRQGKYVCRSTAITTVALAARPAGGQTRIDVIYAQVLDSSSGIVITPGTDGWVIKAVTGVPSGSTPAVPAAPTSSLVLAQVNVTSTGAGTLLATDITDKRHRALSRTSPIQKQLYTQTAPSDGTTATWGTGGWTTVAGCYIYITTYTPNVPLVVSFFARVDGANSASSRLALLIGLGPSYQWTSPPGYKSPQDGFMALTASYVIPTPGTYWLRPEGQAVTGTVSIPGWAHISGTWWDIASATG